MQRSALIPNRTWLNKRSRAPAPVTWSPCLQATTYNLFGYFPVTRGEPLTELNLGVKVVACRHGDQVTGVRMST